jgi:hypothetical protein
MTARKGQPGKDSQDRTATIDQPGKDSRDKTARIVQLEQDNHDGQDNQGINLYLFREKEK